MARTIVSKKHSSVLGLYQFLLKIHPRFYYDCGSAHFDIKTSSRVFSPNNVKRSKDVGNIGIDKSNEIGSRKVEENLPKLNSFETRFFTFEAKIAFIRLKKAFTKALILYYFDPKYHIQIEINGSSFAISGIFSQLTSRYITHINTNLSTFEIGQ